MWARHAHPRGVWMLHILRVAEQVILVAMHDLVRAPDVVGIAADILRKVDIKLRRLLLICRAMMAPPNTRRRHPESPASVSGNAKIVSGVYGGSIW